MKHSLITHISLLLVSTPVISQENLPVIAGKGKTLYHWQTASSKVWKYFGDNKKFTQNMNEKLRMDFFLQINCNTSEKISLWGHLK